MNVSCVPSNAFNIESNNISIKKYPDDLVMYFSGTESELLLNKSEGMDRPFLLPNETWGRVPYPPYIERRGDETTELYTFIDAGYSLSYYKNNFRNFKSGCIRFTTRKNMPYNDYGYQDFGEFKGAEIGSYIISINLYSNSNLTTSVIQSFHVPIVIDETLGTGDLARLNSIINTAINSSSETYNKFYTLITPEGNLRFRTRIGIGVSVVGYLEVPSNGQGNESSVYAWFNKVYKNSYFCAPQVETKIFSLHELTGTNNEISIIHKRDGYIYLYMADETSTYIINKKICPWVWDNEDWIELELNFDDSLSNIIINGEVKAFFETVGVNEAGTTYDNISRSTIQETYLTLVGRGDGYSFKEMDLFNQKQHCGAYTPPASVADKDFDETEYYIDYNFGELKVYRNSTLGIEGEGDLIFEAYDNGVILSYEDGAGIHEVKSGNINEFITLFKNVDYDPSSDLNMDASNLVFRVRFKSEDASLKKFEFDPGYTEEDDPSDPYNFEDLYSWVRRQLGAPQITCELTDDQIYDALCRAVEKYNKYRNWNENLDIQKLYGNDPEDTTLLRRKHTEREGWYYELPANISPKDIVDIFFQPRFSVCWFGAGDNFLNNVMSQTFFGLYGGIVQNSADYYIHRVTCNDISNIIGTQVSWRIYNHHLYLTPNNLYQLDQFIVGIKYRPSLTVEEIRNSEDIKALTLAYAMRTLGLIRGSFGGSIQAGDIAIQLNAETLLAEADKLEEKTINLLKSEQKPLWIIWS